MKKIIFSAIAALALFAACTSEDDISAPKNTLTSDELAQGFITVQYSDETYTTEQADGNYFVYSTNPSRIVTIYQVDSEGNESVLSAGAAAGTFKLSPKRGGDSSQTIYIKTLNYDASEVVATKTYTVYVPTELTAEVRLLASDSYGKKTWKWDVNWREDQAVWGNLGYSAGGGEDGWTGGIWWGCSPEDLTGQLNHSNTGVANGEESTDATMVFDEEGNIYCYDAGGNQIRSGKYSVDDYTGERNIASCDGAVSDWCLGKLTASNTAGDGCILFPFQINGGGTFAKEFEIMNLDAGHLRLIYAPEGTGNWAEATWWAFASNSDDEGSLTEFGVKEWTWDVDWRDDQAVWGNLGYSAGGGYDGWTGGIWWGCSPEDLVGQLNHSNTGVATGEESTDAYMTFDYNTNRVTCYAADGTEIRSGSYEVTNWGEGQRTVASRDEVVSDWALGYLDASTASGDGAIFFPFQINGGGTFATHFEIVNLDSDHLRLIYAPEGTGNWAEATWWAFKKK